MNEKVTCFAELKDSLGYLSDYIEIMDRTHTAILNGDYEERPSIGSIILDDYIEKSKAIVAEIAEAVNEWRLL